MDTHFTPNDAQQRYLDVSLDPKVAPSVEAGSGRREFHKLSAECLHKEGPSELRNVDVAARLFGGLEQA